mgnify:CR=1 FL=1
MTLQMPLSAQSRPWCVAQHVGFGLIGLEWPLLPVWHGTFADAAKVRNPPKVPVGFSAATAKAMSALGWVQSSAFYDEVSIGSLTWAEQVCLAWVAENT